MFLSIEVAARIRKLLDDKKIAHKEIETLLNDSQSNISRWLSINEKVNNVMPNSNLVKIAKYLNTTTDYLLGAVESDVSIEDLLSKLQSLEYSDDNINLLKDALS